MVVRISETRLHNLTLKFWVEKEKVRWIRRPLPLEKMTICNILGSAYQVSDKYNQWYDMLTFMSDMGSSKQCGSVLGLRCEHHTSGRFWVVGFVVARRKVDCCSIDNDSKIRYWKKVASVFKVLNSWHRLEGTHIKLRRLRNFYAHCEMNVSNSCIISMVSLRLVDDAANE